MKEKKYPDKKKQESGNGSKGSSADNKLDILGFLGDRGNLIITLGIILVLILAITIVTVLLGRNNGNAGGTKPDGGNAGTSDVNKQQYKLQSVNEYFDTISIIIGYEASQSEFTAVSREALNLLGEYHKLFDIYNEYDGMVNLCTLNKVVDGQHQKLKVDRKIIDMLLYAKEMYTLTDGRMNIAMGSVLSIWHDYRDAGSLQPVDARIPPMDMLIEAAKHTNIDDIIIDEENCTVWLADPEMKLDVGAIAKGYSVEMVANMLEKKGKTDYTLNIGGNIRTIGTKANGDRWKTGIENPNYTSEYIEYITLAGEAIVTSGSYQRYYIVFTGAQCRECDWSYNQSEGIPSQGVAPGTHPSELKSENRCPVCGSKIRRVSEEFHHIIDRDTLMPADRGFLSVSVICKDSGLGDGLSTALFCMTLEEGMAFVNSLDGVEVMWVTEDEVKHYSDGFSEYITQP